MILLFIDFGTDIANLAMEGKEMKRSPLIMILIMVLAFILPGSTMGQTEGQDGGAFVSLAYEQMNLRATEDMQAPDPPQFESERSGLPSLGPWNRYLGKEKDGARRLYDPAPAWSEETGGKSHEFPQKIRI